MTQPYRRLILLIIVSLLLSLSVGCLAARLENGFDLKGPRGLIGYIGSLISPVFPNCAFDQGNFDQCSFAP